MSSTTSPCAACKFLRRKCTPECIFAPYFPPNNPQRFICVHRVFGASNVSKLLNELPASQREEMVKSLAFEAEARLREPVYGCTYEISILQKLLRQRRDDLANAKTELSAYIDPQAIPAPFNSQEKALSSAKAHLGPSYGPNVVQSSDHLGPSYGPNVVQSSAHLGPSHSPNLVPSLMPSVQHNGSLGGAAAVLNPEEQELLEAQQLAAAAAIREQQQAMMMRNFIQQQQQEYLRHNAAAVIEPAAAVAAYGSDVSGGGLFGHMGAALGGQGGEMAPCLGLGTFDSGGSYHHQFQQPPQHGVGENYLGLATHHHYPLGGQLLLPSEQQALALTQQQQQQQQQLQLLELQALQQQHQLQQRSESDDSKSVGPS